MKVKFKLAPIIAYRHNRLIQFLDQDTIDGVNYAIVHLGTHPCAYVGLKHPSNNKYFIEDSDLDVHGGCTFHTINNTNISYLSREYDWIGWDYAHLGDFSGYDIISGKHHRDVYGNHDKKWTFGEILAEVHRAIKQVKKG